MEKKISPEKTAFKEAIIIAVVCAFFLWAFDYIYLDKELLPSIWQNCVTGGTLGIIIFIVTLIKERRRLKNIERTKQYDPLFENDKNKDK